MPPDLRSLLVRPTSITFTSNLVGPKVISLWARSTLIASTSDLVGAKVNSPEADRTSTTFTRKIFFFFGDFVPGRKVTRYQIFGPDYYTGQVARP
jgi:hypothetical protein